jgi:hypothetical protein
MSLDAEGYSSVNLGLLDTNRWQAGMVRICIRIINKPKYGVHHNNPLKFVCVRVFLITDNGSCEPKHVAVCDVTLKRLRWTASFRLFLTPEEFIMHGEIFRGRRRPSSWRFWGLMQTWENLRNPHVKVPGPIWEHSGWVRNTKANYSPYRLIRCCKAKQSSCLSVREFAFWDLFFGRGLVDVVITDSRHGRFGTHGIIDAYVRS